MSAVRFGNEACSALGMKVSRMTNGLTRQIDELQRLQDIGDSAAPILSVYLNLAPSRRRPGPSVRDFGTC
jgi:hypothetical protein